MNVNLGDTITNGELSESVQAEIDEHVEIMLRTGLRVAAQPAMLLSDPEYPGAYRVWLRALPDLGTIESASAARWVWVDPEGVVIVSAWPWAVTD